ncbi:hypothetical protein HPB50_028181 [Hyalomma asiaticum]|nr:hypothetical protein HPB50_028181 [Hyalomma asiaticum]
MIARRVSLERPWCRAARREELVFSIGQPSPLQLARPLGPQKHGARDRRPTCFFRCGQSANDDAPSQVVAMSGTARLLALCFLSSAVRGVPQQAALEGLVAARDVLSSLETTPLQNVLLQDRTFRVGLGAFNGEAILSNGTLRSVSGVRAVNLTPADDSGPSVIRADLPLSKMVIHYNANVTFNSRSELAEMYVDVDSLELVVELSHEGKGQLELQSIEARDMAEMSVKFVGLRVFQAQSDLLSLLFRGAFRFDIEDEVVAIFEDVLRELVDSHNINNL